MLLISVLYVYKNNGMKVDYLQHTLSECWNNFCSAHSDYFNNDLHSSSRSESIEREDSKDISFLFKREDSLMYSLPHLMLLAKRTIRNVDIRNDSKNIP